MVDIGHSAEPNPAVYPAHHPALSAPCAELDG